MSGDYPVGLLNGRAPKNMTPLEAAEVLTAFEEIHLKQRGSAPEAIASEAARARESIPQVQGVIDDVMRVVDSARVPSAGVIEHLEAKAEASITRRDIDQTTTGDESRLAEPVLGRAPATDAECRAWNEARKNEPPTPVLDDYGRPVILKPPCIHKRHKVELDGIDRCQECGKPMTTVDAVANVQIAVEHLRDAPAEVIKSMHRAVSAAVSTMAQKEEAAMFGGAESFDDVQKPMHYAGGRQYEPRKVIRDWGLSWEKGSALKYIARAGRKGTKEDEVQDLRKAIRYLEMEIEELERK